MTTQKVEEAWEELHTAKLRYDNATTFDNQLYWLKQVKKSALDLHQEIVNALG